MFELFTEPARRVIFYARYEASQFGSTTIESEHFLLGLIREDGRLHEYFPPDSSPIEAIRQQIEDHAPVREKVSASIDLPLSRECKGILSHAREESHRLRHTVIDTSHLLLGILREENCFAANILKGLGLELAAAREEIRRLHAPQPEFRGLPISEVRRSTVPATLLPTAGVVPDDETAKRIAEAVWIPKVSAVPGDQLEAENATLTAAVWIVTGFHQRNDTKTPLAAFIQKEDGKILRLHQETLDS